MLRVPALRAWVLMVGLVGCTFDWDAYAPLGGTTGAGGTPGAGGGGEGAATSGGGVGASGGGGGEAGGGGAGGGVTDPLVNRGLVVRYFIDEAASGMGPTALVDAAANPLGLALTYSMGLSWGGVDPQRGLVWNAVDTPGDARVAIAGTKISAQLHGSMSATIEAVVNITNANGGNTHITCIGPGGNAGGLSLLLNGPNQVRLVWHEGVNIGTWNVGITTLGRVVLHAVLDSAQPTASDRTRLYVDGVLANMTGGTPPAQNELTDLTPDVDFVVGNGVGAILSPAGTIHYVAMYGVGLTQQEAQTNAQRLIVSDDTVP